MATPDVGRRRCVSEAGSGLGAQSGPRRWLPVALATDARGPTCAIRWMSAALGPPSLTPVSH